MIEAARQRYETLCNGLQALQQANEAPTICLERSFGLAVQTAYTLRADLARHVFATSAEEIDFFKNVHPFFLTEIRFLDLLYHAELFKPLDSGTAVRFWRREAEKVQHFPEAHRDFLTGLGAGEEAFDNLYFRRGGQGPEKSNKQLVDELAEYGTTVGAILLGNYKALQRYAFVVQQHTGCTVENQDDRA